MEEEDKTKGRPDQEPGDTQDSSCPTRVPSEPDAAMHTSDPSSGSRRSIGAECPEDAQTLDLSGFFTKHVNTSGSFHAKGIGATLLGRVLEALPVPAMLIDRSRQITFSNQACGKIDTRFQSIIGKPFHSLFPYQDAAEKARSILESVFSTRNPLHHVAYLQINEGRIWGRVTLRSVRIGRDRFLLAVIEDLTAEKRQLLLIQKYNDQLKEEISRRKLAEQTLRQSEQRFELAMKGADLAWWDWNIQSGSLVCDKFFSEMLGYSADEILPRKSSWEQLVHPDDASRFAESLKAHFENTAPYLEIEHRVHSKSGDWKWVSTRGRVVERDQAGRPLRVSGTNLDITQAKEAQERIDALTQAMIQAQERERERVSLDLHDQVAQSLAAVRLSLQTIFDDVRSANPELSERIAQVSAAIREIARDVRDLSYELRPPGLDQLGLTSAVRQYCREFSTRHGLSVDFFSEGIEDLPLDFDTEINIFRVIQEGLNNVAKHAGARRVVIRLTVSESKIDLSIKDDGRGFDVKRESADAIEDKRMGLWCMAQRIGLLRGQMDVVSGAPEGTEIVVEIPCGGDEPCGKKKGS